MDDDILPAKHVGRDMPPNAKRGPVDEQGSSDFELRGNLGNLSFELVAAQCVSLSSLETSELS